MVKRKFYASMLMLIVAVTTLVTGTYAWFLVGGFGSLFDLGFDVIEAGAGIQLRGSAQPAADESWKTMLERADFLDNSFLPAEDTAAGIAAGKYAPLSSANPTGFDQFVRVSIVENEQYESTRLIEEDKGNYYNDFTLFIRSTAESANARMFVKIDSTKIIKNAAGEDEEVQAAARNAARVSVTYGGTTTIYALDDDGDGSVAADTNAVTSEFLLGAVTENGVGTADEDHIITSADTGFAAAGLSAQEVVLVNPSGIITTAANSEVGKGILLENIPGSDNLTGAEIQVRVWIEGNDADCIDFGDAKISGDNLDVKISFGTE